MASSLILYRGIEKTISSVKLSYEDKTAEIKRLFTEGAWMIPPDMVEDLFYWYNDESRFRPEGNIDSLRDLSYRLVDVLDLFSMDYNEKDDPLSIEEWKTLSNLVSEYAADIDDELLTYVMQLAVAKGAFH